MAEFVEVIKNQKRMCEGYLCINCPLCVTNNGRNMSCTELRRKYPEEYEAIVTKWAEERPVKTHKDKLYELMASAFGEQAASNFTRELTQCAGFTCSANRCEGCKYKTFWEEEYKDE